MRRYLLTILLCITGGLFAGAQQNHVLNGSFEDYSQCPTGISQLSRATGWFNYTSTTPDFFHCTLVPATYSGWQMPAHGNALAGIWCNNGAASNYKEYLGTQIIPLVPGASYEVSMSLSLANSSRIATNDIGAYFFTSGSTSIPVVSSLPVTPQVYYNTFPSVKDTMGWVRLSKNFVADSAYQYMVVGSFLDYNLQPKDTVWANTTSNQCYYYVDSIVVKLADSLFFDLPKTEFCSGDTLTISYQSYKRKQANNVFSLQLSDATGSFASPVTIGTRAFDTSGTIFLTIPVGTPTGSGYKIRLLASNFADTSSSIYEVKIGQGPIAKPVAGNNGPVCVGNELKLTATTTTPGVTWSWMGPNSFTSPLQNPTIAAAAVANNGQYIVTAKLYGCRAADTTNVTVANSSILGAISASSNSPVCAGDTLKLTGNSGATGVTYSWSGPNGFSATTQNATIPGVTTAAAGTYFFKVSNGVCQLQASTNVVVNPSAGSVTATANTPCEGNSLQFNATASSSTGVIFGWAGPNSYTSSLQNPVIGSAAPIHAGRYIVSATINLCIVKDTVDVTIKPTPAKPDANNNGPLCEGAQLNLTSTTTTSGVTYGWTGPASYTSATQNNTINNSTTAMSGDYIVTVNLNGCEAKDTTTVLVKPIPATTTLSSNAPICAGSSLQLFSTASSTGASYAWNGPNSYTANTQNANLPNATTSASGWYRQTLSLNGCSRKDSVLVAVNAIPAAPTAGYTGPVCATEQLKLTATNVPGATYQWIGPNGYTSNIQNATRNNITIADAGNYIVRATVNGCTSTDAAVSVSVNPTPFVVITTPTDSICQGVPTLFSSFANNTGGTPQYKWYVNSQLAGTGNSFTSSTLNDKDVVRCDMTDNAKCSAPFVDASNDITMTVLPWLAPSVTIAATPSTTVKENEYITFTATPTNGGNKPTYQWKRNGQNVQGATSNVWSANSLSDNDVITAELISNYKCPQPATATSNDIKVKVIPTGVNDINTLKGINLYPNPNNGTFTISGKTDVNGMATAQVINTVGQVVYEKHFDIQGHIVNEEINTGSIAAGVYILKLSATDGQAAILKFNKQ